MKKFIMVSMIALIAAFGFVGCSQEDESLADLKWKNNDTDPVSEIQWIKNGSTKVDQTWGDTYASGGETQYKGIAELAGTGECVSGGATATIVLDTGLSTGVASISSNSAVITENAAATLVIQSVKKK